MSEYALKLNDVAFAAAKEAAHAASNRVARDHYELALAHLREAWIAEDGQNARSAEQLHKDVVGPLRLFERLAAKAQAEEVWG